MPLYKYTYTSTSSANHTLIELPIRSSILTKKGVVLIQSDSWQWLLKMFVIKRSNGFSKTNERISITLCKHLFLRLEVLTKEGVLKYSKRLNFQTLETRLFFYLTVPLQYSFITIQCVLWGYFSNTGRQLCTRYDPPFLYLWKWAKVSKGRYGVWGCRPSKCGHETVWKRGESVRPQAEPRWG